MFFNVVLLCSPLCCFSLCFGSVSVAVCIVFMFNHKSFGRYGAGPALYLGRAYILNNFTFIFLCIRFPNNKINTKNELHFSSCTCLSMFLWL